ncbi:MFS general substrate transporter [Setomelanomma holmii]|uniref:MFS general substrate transporter n=1 Tax=Setomelanomma holmii TaxID=210430 RepID=A0A9P4HH15_9PLEO|nr:MFS general substrate transporter [Setomelanomma holmii]
MSLWSLPHKTQLFVLMLARLTDSLTAHSIHSYMFFQIRHFNPNAPVATIITQCGLLVGAKTAAHVCTGLVWGRLADSALKSRKIVLVVGLLASSVVTVGYGFSTTFPQAIAWQMLDGALNANVAMARCMTAELQPEKSHRVRAFTLLPLFANFGAVLGPLIGGFLSSANTQHSIVPGYPYAMPNICVAAIEAMVAIAVLVSVTDSFRDDQKKRSEPSFATAPADSTGLAKSTVEEDVNETTALLHSDPAVAGNHETRIGSVHPDFSTMPFKAIWTPNVLRTMFAQFVIVGHLGTFATLWALLLSLPVASSRIEHPLFHFSGGLGLQPHTVGFVLSAFGLAGIFLQILVYPGLQERWGTIRVWRGALYLFPIVYFIAPFCALVPLLGRNAGPRDSGLYAFIQWSALLSVLILFAAGRTGVVPATSLLINECTPHASVRGTIHTTGVICSNLSKSVFPPMALAVMGYGLQNGVVGLGFWFVAILALLSIVASIQVREGTNGE